MNCFERGRLGALVFTAALGAKDHRDRSPVEVTVTFVTIAAKSVSATELSTLIRAPSGRAYRCDQMIAGAAGLHPSIRHLGLLGDLSSRAVLQMAKCSR